MKAKYHCLDFIPPSNSTRGSRDFSTTLETPNSGQNQFSGGKGKYQNPDSIPILIPGADWDFGATLEMPNCRQNSFPGGKGRRSFHTGRKMQKRGFFFANFNLPPLIFTVKTLRFACCVRPMWYGLDKGKYQCWIPLPAFQERIQRFWSEMEAGGSRSYIGTSDEGAQLYFPQNIQDLGPNLEKESL